MSDERKAMKLTRLEINDLSRAAHHADGVFRIDGPRGLRYASKTRSVGKMVAAGLLEPNPHGDWYITKQGRALIVLEEQPHDHP